MLARAGRESGTGTYFQHDREAHRELAEGWSIFKAFQTDAPDNVIEEVTHITNELIDSLSSLISLRDTTV